MSENQTTMSIELSLIKANPDNPRKIITPAMVDNMTASLKAVGLKNPIKVIALADGAYEVISGHIRLAGATQLGWSTIPAVVLTLTPEQALLEAILDNRGEPMTWLDTYIAVESMLKIDPNLTQQAVGDQLGIDQTTVSKAVKVTNQLNPASRAQIYDQIIKSPDTAITQRAVLALVGLADPQKVEDALRVVIAKKMTESQAKALVASMQAGHPANTPVVLAQPKRASRLEASAQVADAHPAAATPKTEMSETESLLWGEAAGISVITQIKAKIKKGKRPSFFEALLLMGHYVWRGLVWLNKNGFKLIGRILKFAGKLLLDALKSIARMFGETFYKVAQLVVILVILGSMAWLAWDIYHHGPLHPVRAIASRVWPTQAPTIAPSPIPTVQQTVVTSPTSGISSPLGTQEAPTMVPTALSATVATPTVMAEVKPVAVKKHSKPVQQVAALEASVNTAVPTPTVVKKTDIAGDVLKQAAPAGVDVAKKLFGL